MQNDKITDKLRKLIALAARASTPEESANAFAAAQAMATKHRIELAEIGDAPESDPIGRMTLNEPGKRVAGWRKKLAWGVCLAQGVYCVFLQGLGAFTLAGRQSDCDASTYLYRAISAEIDRLGKGKSGAGASYINAFKLGAATTVVRRMLDARDQTVNDARASGTPEAALVLVDSARDIGEAFYLARLEKNERAPHNRARVVSSSRAGLADGRTAGKSINIGGNAALGKGAQALGA